MRTLRPWVRACAFAVVLLAEAPPVGAAEPEVHEGRRVRVHSSVPGTAERAAEDLDAALEVYAEHLPWRLPEGERLVLRLHASQAEYAEAVRAGGAAELEGSQAATVWSTLESHVVVQPRSEPAYLGRVGGLPEFTRFLVWHEGVHQLLHRAGAPRVRRWPDWCGEGMADWVAERCLERLVGREPRAVLLEDRDDLVRSALEEGRAPSLERLLHAKAESVADKRLAYACWHSLYGLLAADPARMADLHGRVRRVCEAAAGDTPADGVALSRAFAAALDGAAGPLGDLEARWSRAARARRPEWFEGVRAAQRSGDELLLASWPEENAYALRAEPAPSSAFEVSLEMHLLDLGSRQADLYLGYERRSDTRFLKVALGASGYATLLAYSDGHWQERYRASAEVDATRLAASRWVPVRVRAGDGRVRVEVAGTLVLDAEVPPAFRVEGNRVGVGCHDGACRFRGLRIAPLKGR